MPSDKTPVTVQEHQVFRMRQDSPSDPYETKDLWKEVRKFYRTGKKMDGSKNQNLYSVFVKLLKTESPQVSDGQTDYQLSPQLPFQIINEQIKNYRENVIDAFKERLKNIVDKLERLLEVKTSNRSEKEVFGFAEEIIVFDKLSGLVPTKEGAALTTGRSQRLSAVLDNLKDGLAIYDSRKPLILQKEDDIGKLKLPEIRLKTVEEEQLLSEARQACKHEMKHFVELLRSVRLAELEIEGSYNQEKHDDFYSDFTWYRLTEEEKRFFLPVMVVLDHDFLGKNLNAYSDLASLNWPLKIVVLNRQWFSSPDPNTDWDIASHGFRQELVSLTISLRNVFIYQSSLGDPDDLKSGLKLFIHNHSTAVAHLLIPTGNESHRYVKSRAAGLGRYFPTITYDPLVPTHSKRLTVNKSEQTQGPWSKFDILIANGSRKEDGSSIFLTYADYKAFYREKIEELMVIPSFLDKEELLPLGEYLDLPKDQLVGKIPFIWLCDDSDHLVRAVVPNLWVISCQERLDFWSYLKEFSESGSIEPKEQKAGNKKPKVPKKLKKLPIKQKKTTIHVALDPSVEMTNEDSKVKAVEQLLLALLKD